MKKINSYDVVTRLLFVFIFLVCIACNPKTEHLNLDENDNLVEDMGAEEDMSLREDMNLEEDMNPKEDMSLEEDMMIQLCEEGFEDHDLNPDTPCEPLWSSPVIEGSLEYEAWIGEPFEVELLVSSADVRPLSYEWRLVDESGVPIDGFAIDYEVEASKLRLPIAQGTHRQVLFWSLQVIDSIDQSSEMRISVTLLNRIERAIETGDPGDIANEEGELLQKILDESSRLEGLQSDLVQRLFAGASISYDPTRHSQFFTPLHLSEVTPLILGNGGRLLAAIVDRAVGRAAAFGTAVLLKAARGELTSVEPMIERVLRWLMDEPLDLNLELNARLIKSVGLSDIAHAQANQFFIEVSPNLTFERCEMTLSEEELIVCLNAADLIIVGTAVDEEATESLLSAVQTSINRGIPLLYTHMHGWNSARVTPLLLELIGLSIEGPGGPGNYFSQDRAEWMSVADMLRDRDLAGIASMARLFLSGEPSLDLSRCEGGCDDDDDYQVHFARAAKRVRSSNQSLLARAEDLFELSGERLHKLLVLLGDLWRRGVSFPMDRVSTPSLEFLRSYYADHAHLSLRRINPSSPDLGDFSRTDFSHIIPETLEESYIPKHPFRSARVYALPGQSFTVTRLDQEDSRHVSIQINSLRDGSVHEFSERGYTRPKFVSSAIAPLSVGETLTFTSAYGGPVMIHFRGAELGSETDDEREIRLRFEGIGRHPVWHSSEDDLSFVEAMNRDEYDWAEFLTPHFEIHSTRDKMISTLAHPLSTSPSELAELINTYHHGYSLALAGYRGPDIIEVPEIRDFITDRSWPIPYRDVIQHFNADKPTCGAGCSGNPYDAGWAFSPLGHGDLHEVGHNHERGRFKFSGREGHATTNYYSYFTQQQHSLDTGREPNCQNLPFHELFDLLQDAQNNDNPFETMAQDPSLNGWSQGVAIVIQALMAAERMGAISRGWYLIARLHAHERAFNQAREQDQSWLEARDALGFAALSRQEANQISNNDYLFVALSMVTGLNYQNYFEMWGLDLSPALEWLVLSQGDPLVPRVFYTAEASAACDLWDAREVPIDGQSLWIDLSLFDRQSVNLDQTYLSAPYQSEGSSVYFVTLDEEVGPNQRVWWGMDQQLTELTVPLVHQVSGTEEDFVIDAFQQRCDTFITLNAGRVGGCDHRLSLSIDPNKNRELPNGVYQTSEALPLILEAWRWHAPEELIDTLVLDLRYTQP